MGSAVKNLDFSIVSTYTHRSDAYSQGLVLNGDRLYESKGLYGQSSVAVLSFPDGKIINEKPLDDAFFGEGLTLAGNELIQLTWKAGKVFRYDYESLELKETLSIDGEGWGITEYKNELVTSNGSATLTFRNPETLEPNKTLAVTFAGRPLAKLNELETMGDFIAANVFQSNNVVFIDPDSGAVIGKLDLSNIARREQQTGKANVTNGIAYDADNDRLLVTGKLWQRLYEIELDSAFRELIGI